ncbi:hypothetical protein [Polaribacter sp.]|uniref:hypothetical protein n=1 Tax=Polaribacter sp. TaxID=1920175 RepID=UPI003F6D5AF5
MIDRLFQTVQAGLDKEQKDYLRPLYFNLYLNSSLFTVFNKLLSDVKSNTRKSNWMLDGKNLADYEEHTKQLLEHYLTSKNVTSGNGYFDLSSDISLIQDVSKDSVILEKVDIDDFTLLKRSKDNPPTECSPICTKLGSTLLVAPTSINDIDLIYLRTPSKAKWTFEEVDGKPMFDPTKSDFADVDAPPLLFDELYYSIMSQAGVATREQLVVQSAEQNENQNIQVENKQ